MSRYLYNNADVSVLSDDVMILKEELVPAVYLVRENKDGNLYLERSNEFEVGHKVYGDQGRIINRVENTYSSRESNTGVMLYGEKGSGKTLFVKSLSKGELGQKLPIIIVSENFHEETLCNFLFKIKDEAIVVFDEFDKNFSRKENQAPFLSLLDGVFKGKKLFIFCCNEIDGIHECFFDRPGRIFYKIFFGELEDDIIEIYCEENLKNKDFLEDIKKIKYIVNIFTFDILKAIVEECNRYNESPMLFVDIFNLDCELEKEYLVKVFDKKAQKFYKKSSTYDFSIFNFLQKEMCDEIGWKTKEEGYVYYLPIKKDLRINEKGKIVFENEELKITLAREENVAMKDFLLKNEMGI